MDPLSVAAGEQGQVLFKKGTRYWFLVEIFPSDGPPAREVRRIGEGPLAGFRFLDADREVAILHNPTDQTAEADLPLTDAAGVAGAKRSMPQQPTRSMIYEDQSGKGRPGPRRLRLEPGRHVVVVASRGP